jgi:hypothetical protein
LESSWLEGNSNAQPSVARSCVLNVCIMY